MTLGYTVGKPYAQRVHLVFIVFPTSLEYHVPFLVHKTYDTYLSYVKRFFVALFYSYNAYKLCTNGSLRNIYENVPLLYRHFLMNFRSRCITISYARTPTKTVQCRLIIIITPYVRFRRQQQRQRPNRWRFDGVHRVTHSPPPLRAHTYCYDNCNATRGGNTRIIVLAFRPLVILVQRNDIRKPISMEVHNFRYF